MDEYLLIFAHIYSFQILMRLLHTLLIIGVATGISGCKEKSIAEKAGRKILKQEVLTDEEARDFVEARKKGDVEFISKFSKLEWAQIDTLIAKGGYSHLAPDRV
jgi:hypothetical protein